MAQEALKTQIDSLQWEINHLDSENQKLRDVNPERPQFVGMEDELSLAKEDITNLTAEVNLQRQQLAERDERITEDERKITELSKEIESLTTTVQESIPCNSTRLYEMASKDLTDLLKDLTLEEIVPQNKELGRGAYGKVFKVDHLGLPCAAKEIHSLLLDGVSREEKKAIKDGFIRECYHSSLIRHPNIVQFLGVYYANPSDPRSDLPIMVMELMDTSLTSFIENNQSKITISRKLSILHDTSLGLSHLHARCPAVIHRDLSSNNVLLTSHLVAKISDLGTAKVIRADSKQTKSKLTTAPGTLHFMPPEALDEEDPMYSTPVDVFSFAAVALHLFSEKWPTPSGHLKRDPRTIKMVLVTEVERRQQYLDTMTVEAAVFKEMVIRCLDADPYQRPPIQEVSVMIKSLKETPPPFAEALQSDQYLIKWTTCADLPTPMYDAYVAVSNGTIYCTGSTPNDDNDNDVYSFDTKSNEWKQLSRPGHRLGVIHMIDNKMTIFGGIEPVTNNPHNKVTTYNSKTNSWYSCYPNMLHNRHKPGIITSHDHVIVMGGKSTVDTDHDNIEVMNYHQLQWKEIRVHLPVPMWAIRPTITGDYITIVGYAQAEDCSKRCYQIPVQDMMSSLDQPLSTGEVTQWKKFSPAPHWKTVTVPYSNPPVIMGGSSHSSQGGAPTSDVCIYDSSNNSWRKVDSLTSARSNTGISLINSNTVIIIGGCTKGVGGIEAAMSSSLTLVEIGNPVANQ